jgi:NAD+ kinase
MHKEFRTIALIGKYQSPEVADTLLVLGSFLREAGKAVIVEAETAQSADISGYETADYEHIGIQADLAIVLGGDGTMLHASRRLAEFGVPLVGVNQGRLGFMTDIARPLMLESIAAVLAGDCASERRCLLEVEVVRGSDRICHNRALNDVVVNKGDLGRMIELEVKVDGELIYVLRADGMIVSTPTGSTAYALSANGPILHPSVPGIAIVPLCPHALSNRPITISDSSQIDISLLHPHDARIHFDGQGHCDAVAGDVVKISRSPFALTLLHPPGYSYFAMLREKLQWSATPRHNGA